MKWTGYVARVGERILAGTPEGRPLERLNRTRKDNVEMDVWIRKTNEMSLFVFFISLLIVAQHVSGNHVPIIRS